MKLLQIKVKPNACTDALEAQADGSWVARIAAAPVEGAANEALLRLVAKQFGVPRSQVRLKSGASSRTKRVEIAD